MAPPGRVVGKVMDHWPLPPTVAVPITLVSVFSTKKTVSPELPVPEMVFNNTVVVP